MLGHYDDVNNDPPSPRTYAEIENILAENLHVEEQLREMAELQASQNV